MAGFQVPVDIGNRALQHLGIKRITAAQLLTPTDKQSSAIANCYDKLRVAELRRNVWTFSTRKAPLRPVDTTTMNVVPAAFDATKQYLLGSIVSYGGLYWHANALIPAGGATPDQNQGYTAWTLYFGPLTATLFNNTSGLLPWNSGTTYQAGALVAGSDGYEYSSQINGNLGNNPVGDGGVHWYKVGKAPQSVGYYAGELVYTVSGSTGTIYLSLVSQNAVDPSLGPPAWVSTQTYSKGQTVTYSSVVYQSTTDLNINNTPTGAGAWVTVPVTQNDQMVGSNWLKLGSPAALTSLQIIYPVGSGPLSQTVTRNVFVLPNGYLKRAPKDPKQGGVSYLGSPSGLGYDDWEFENGYLISRESQPIVFRFAADHAYVPTMDTMFCEGLGCRIALEVCEDLTQSTEKANMIAGLYKTFMGEARLANGIEEGSEEPAMDDWITCRI